MYLGVDLLSLFPDRYLLQPSKFVFCSPLPAEGNMGSISSHLQIAEELLHGMITRASFSHGVGDSSKQGGRVPLSRRWVGWWLPHAMGLQSLSRGLAAVYSSPICLAMVFLALGPDYYGERWGVGLWFGCVLWWAGTGAPGCLWTSAPHGRRCLVADSGHPRGSRAMAGCGTLWELWEYVTLPKPDE